MKFLAIAVLLAMAGCTTDAKVYDLILKSQHQWVVVDVETAAAALGIPIKDDTSPDVLLAIASDIESAVLMVSCADHPGPGLVPMIAIAVGYNRGSLPSKIGFRGNRYAVKPVDTETGTYTTYSHDANFGIIGDEALPIIRLIGNGDPISFTLPDPAIFPTRGAEEAMNRVLETCA